MSTNPNTSIPVIQYHPKPRSTIELDQWPTPKKTRSNRSRLIWLGYSRLKLDQHGPSLRSLPPCAVIALRELLIAHGHWSERRSLSRRIGYGIGVTVIVVGFGSLLRTCAHTRARTHTHTQIWNITIWEIWFYFCEIVGLLKKKKNKTKKKKIYIKAYVAFLPHKCWHGHLNLDTSASDLIFK